MTDAIGQLDDADRLQRVQGTRDARYTFYSIVPSDHDAVPDADREAADSD